MKEDLYEELIELVKALEEDIANCREKGERKKKMFQTEAQRQVKRVKEDADALSREVNNPALLEWTPNTEEMLARFAPLQEKCETLKESAQQCLNIQAALEVESSRFDFVEEVASEIDLRVELWNSLRQFRTFADDQRTTRFLDTNIKAIEDATEYFSKVVLRCENRGHKEAPAVQQLRREVGQYKDLVPVVQALGNKKLKSYHWTEIKQTLSTELPLEMREFTLDTLIELGAAKFAVPIRNISVTASQECWLKKQLKQIKAKWDKRGFVFKQYAREQQRDQVTIIAESNLLFVDLDETQTTINTILGSSYGKRLADRAVLAKQQYDILWQVVDEWLQCQRNWMYLDSIFSSLDIRAHLKKETADFEAVDKQWRHIMRTVSVASKNVLILYANTEHFEKLCKLNRNMEKIKKELHHYLDSKRREFPRFYFLSDGELLPIMSRETNVSAIESVLPKCFEGIAGLELGPGRPPSEITGVTSAEGETIPLKTIRIYSEENAVLWLRSVEMQTFEVMKRLVKSGYNDYFQDESDRRSWVLTHCSQAVFCVTQLIWTESCEYAIRELQEDTEALSEIWQQSGQHVTQLAEAVHGSDISPLRRNILVSVITRDVHWRDVIDRLVSADVSDIQDFVWQSQLRYYLEEGSDADEVRVRQVNGEVIYGYEYVGGCSQLVVTPITERCQLTMTSALQVHLGASLAGPAGTGKTETVKDLARAVAVQCVVFNCSEQIEIKIVARLLSGLAQQGAWTCLDEFNRIDTEVLSVIAQQLLHIHDSLQAGRPTVTLNDLEIKLNGGIGIFITMNPDFANRNELPDNLKVLFRPVSFMVPDAVQIAEVLLFAQGFKEAKVLAGKMMLLYRFAAEELSPQPHYDFGMRSIKSVLILAGNMRQTAKKGTSEVDILLKAIRYASLSKFLQTDLELFLDLMHDLFPTAGPAPHEERSPLSEELEKVCPPLGLRPGNRFFAKVRQLHENLASRVGVMLIGAPGVGKSACCRALQAAVTAMGKRDPSVGPLPVESHVVFPKALSLGELYGEEMKETKEWKYGVASKIIKKAGAKTATWLVFDGPLESQWVENLNSVLDDSRMLCLANAERIKLGENVRLVFEVEDMGRANPATVSRCGMVYLSQDDIGWKAYLGAWADRTLRTVEVYRTCEDLRTLLNYLLEDSVEKVMTALATIKGREQRVPTTTAQNLAGFAGWMEYWSEHILSVDPLELKKKKLTAYFAFSLIWSFGGALTQSGRQELDSAVRPMFPRLGVPYSGTLFDYRIEVVESSSQVRWVPWREQVPRFESGAGGPSYALFVPTGESTRCSYVLQLSLEMLRPTLFIGPRGAGKSAMLQHFLAGRTLEEGGKASSAERLQIVPFVFSSATSPRDVQSGIEAKLESRAGKRVLAPTGQRKALIFVDDLNMPSKERSGAAPALELLRQMLTYRGFYYGKSKLRWTELLDTTLLCAAAPRRGGNEAEIPLRLSHLFNVFWVGQPSAETIRAIFEAILTNFLEAAPFVDPVRKLGTTVVMAVGELYAKVIERLKPVPTKFFYRFDLRDVSRVFQAILMTTPQSITGAESFVRLWTHECARTFGDRLSGLEDRLWLHETIVSLVSTRFRYEWSSEELFSKHPILFTDLQHREVDDPDKRIYEEVTDIRKLSKTLDEALIEYNCKNLNNKMNLVFFDDAVYYIAAIARTLRQRRGHCLLIGMSGCGKESYTSLAAFVLGSSRFKARGSRSYRKENFREDIKAVMRSSGVDGKSVTFMLSEYQMSGEGFLEDVNSILNTGEVNSLYRAEETEAILKDMAPVLQSFKRLETRENKHSLFVERVRDNFHVVLSASPVGDTLRLNCRKYPSLLSCCAPIYFYPWPEQAYESVCEKLISELESVDKPTQRRLARMFPRAHLTVGRTAATYEEETRKRFYVTPKIYIDAIRFFMGAYTEALNRFRGSLERLGKGLRNFQAANRMVSQLQATLTRLQPVIEANNVKANKALEQKELESQKVFEEEKKIETEKNMLYQQKAIIELSQSEARKELGKIQPLLDEARQGLETINPKDLAKIKSYLKPPQTVMIVMEAVAILVSNEQKELKLSWEGAKELLTEKGFFKRLKELDFAKLTSHTVRMLHEYTIDFDPEEIALSDTASVSLAKWCIAMEKCYIAYQKVAPLEEKVRRIQAEYTEKQREVAMMEEALQVVKDQLKILDTECRKLGDEAKIIMEQKEKTAYQLSNAELLAKLLRDEGQRWTRIVERMHEGEKDILGDTFLTAACISYSGPFTARYREQLLSAWKELSKEHCMCFSRDYSLVSALGNPLELKTWNLRGLPADHVSMENGLLAMKTNRWALMVDPEGQANRWVKNVERENGICALNMAAEGAENLKAIVHAIQLGKPLLLEDVAAEIDSSLYNVLGRQTFRTDVEDRIYVGDKDVPYNPTFKLYLTTKQANPHFVPEVCNMVSIVNFAVTFEALEEQLLVEVILKERPEMEADRTRQILETAKYQKLLRDIEEDILERLTSATEETILMNVELIQSLERTKKSSQEIERKIRDAQLVEAQINTVREQYRTVATRGAVLYFVLADLAKVNYMYQFSFAFLKQLFTGAIGQAALSIPPNADMELRRQKMAAAVTESVYIHVCRGIFEAHKLLFAFLVASSIGLHTGLFSQQEVALFCRDPAVLRPRITPPRPKGVSESGWTVACATESSLKHFEGLTKSLTHEAYQWETYAKSADPYNERNTSPLTKLNPVEGLIMAKIMHPEKVRQACIRFVSERLGALYTDYRSTRLEDAFLEPALSPVVVFVLSPGADPTGRLKQVAQSAGKTELRIISLGKEQEGRAEREFQDARRNGRWLLLQNCHLVKSFMPKLETLVGSLESDSGNPQFRLLLTSMPVEHFPASVLQAAVKHTTESPAGVKAQLYNAFVGMGPDEFVSRSKPREWRSLLFGLTLFHAVVQERGKFGSLGWNVQYRFNTSDLEMSKSTLRSFLEKRESIPWDALDFFAGHINYGGRVTDEHDRKLLLCTFRKFVNPEMLAQPNYRFSDSLALKEFTTVQDCLAHILTLPEIDGTALFGMHENADLAYQSQLSASLLSDLAAIQPNQKCVAEPQVAELVRKLKAGMPSSISCVAEAKEDSMRRIVWYECDRYNALLRGMGESLALLDEALAGGAHMSQDLDDMYTALAAHKVPSQWKMYDSLLSLGAWYTNLLLRVEFVRQWRSGHTTMKCCWLPALMGPRGFLVALLQAGARKLEKPVDSLVFHFEVTSCTRPEQIKEPPENGAYISGFYLESAGWSPSKQSLCDPQKGQLRVPMPVIHLITVPAEEKRAANTYSCPVYRTATRRSGTEEAFVMAVDLPTDESAEKWTLRGTALLCEASAE